MARRKKKTRSLKSMSHKSIVEAEKHHYGDEPDFTDNLTAGVKRIKAVDKDGNPDPELAYLKAMNWYNALGNDTHYKKWVVDYAKAVLGLKPVELVSIKAVNDFDRTLAIHARLTVRGGGQLMSADKQKQTKQEVINLLAAQKKKEAKKKTQKETETDKPSKPSVQEYMQMAAESVYGEKIVSAIDDIFSEGAKKSSLIDTYAVLNAAGVKGRVALKIAELIQPTIDELTTSMSGKEKDQDLAEAYSYLTTAKKRKVLEALQAMVDDCNRINNVSKKTRKTRAKKAPSAAKLLATFKYKEKDDEYKIASADPKKIAGASSVVLFNTKTRKGSWICAEGPVGLNIKGASIIGYDEKTSVQKTIRKPSEFIAGTNGKGKRAIKNTFDSINAKNSFSNGKVNAHTIILTIVK